MQKFLMIFLLIVILFSSVVPVYWTFITSLSTVSNLSETASNWFPTHPTLMNYSQILKVGLGTVGSEFVASIFNSTVVALFTTIITLFLASLAAYSIERLKVPLRRLISFSVVLTQMLPPVTLVIPLYLLLARFGLLNSKASLIMIYTTLQLPFAIWILSSYFRQLPQSVEEAAIIDGSSYLGVLWRILIPLSKPALFTAGIFVFLASWNEFLIALVITSSLQSKTLPVAIAEFMGRFYVNYPLMTAAGIFSMLPPIIFASIFQRFLIGGLALGAVKG